MREEWPPPRSPDTAKQVFVGDIVLLSMNYQICKNELTSTLINMEFCVVVVVIIICHFTTNIAYSLLPLTLTSTYV